jgi:hypothetical protein
MTGVVGVLRGIPAPDDRWNDTRRVKDVLDALVYRSNLLGSDRALANEGGGNTSAKGVVSDHAGEERRVLWVKGSGTDLASITARPGWAELTAVKEGHVVLLDDDLASRWGPRVVDLLRLIVDAVAKVPA